MNYAITYHPHWQVSFLDLLGAQWDIYIETGEISRDIVQLVPAANPFEWDGIGGTDQTKVRCGSTGYLRIVVTGATEREIERLRPFLINSHRITAKRNGAIAWQGFLKQEEYNQQRECAPYELEIPVWSALAATEKFTLPPYKSSTGIDAISSGVTDTAGMLRWLVRIMGIDVDAFCTNSPVYRNYIGEQSFDSDGVARHWTQSQCYATYFYDRQETSIEPKTVAEVLDTLLSPWCKMREYAGRWYFMLDSTSKIYTISTMNAKIDTGNRFDGSEPYDECEFSGELAIMSTDITDSIVAAPSAVVTKINYEKVSKIFEPSIEMATAMPSVSRIYTSDYWKAVYDAGVINMSDYATISHSLGNIHVFNSVVHLSEAEHGYESDLSFPIGVSSSGKNTVTFRLCAGVKSIQGVSNIKLSAKVISLNNGEFQGNVQCKLYDATVNKYINSSGEWKDDASFYPHGDNYAIYFNELRTENDKNLHFLEFTINFNESSGCVFFTLEYTEHHDKSDASVTNIFVDKILRKDSITQNYGEGPKIDAVCKTLGGIVPTPAACTGEVPFAGFYDALAVDLSERKVLDITEARRNVIGQELDLAFKPATIVDGLRRYVIASCGCNAREASSKVKLVEIHNV